MKDNKKLKKIIKTVVKEYVDKDIKEKKYFSIIDKTGRSSKPYKLDKAHIENSWDLSEEDWTSDQTLEDFLEDCYIGDVWETRTEQIECISIK